MSEIPLEDVEFWVWQARGQWSVIEDDCRHVVHTDRYPAGRQCFIPPTEEIHGFKFCTLHANMIRKRAKYG